MLVEELFKGFVAVLTAVCHLSWGDRSTRCPGAMTATTAVTTGATAVTTGATAVTTGITAVTTATDTATDLAPR
ncbi:hypothetical protein [Streptomyces flaveolus]|uniref:hypothetical protein n=1 Tax=Streptomyces flaveolus TaxID=67297 RepID=UPI00340A24A9